MDEHERTAELRRVRDDAVALVCGRIESQIPLSVMRVVQRPVGRRSARAGRGERVGRVQHGERGQEAAVGPADHRHAAEVGFRHGNAGFGGDRGKRVGQRVHGVDLVLKRHGFHVFVDRAIPLRSAAGGAATVGGDHDVALVGPPLRVPVERLAFHDLLETGAAVRLHEDRQLVGIRVCAVRRRQDDRRVQGAFAEADESHVRHETGGFGVVFDRRNHHRHHVGGVDAITITVRRAHVHAMLHLHRGIVHATAGHHATVAGAAHRPLSGNVGERLPVAVVTDRDHVEAAGVVIVRVGLPQERQIGGRQQFRRALHHAQHVVVGHVEHFAHLQALGCEWRAVHGQTVRVGVHVVHRAHETAVRRVCGGAGDQVEPAVVAMFLKHARGAGFFAGRVFGDGDGEGLHFAAVLVGEAVFRRAHGHDRLAHVDGEHLVVLLKPVLHK